MRSTSLLVPAVLCVLAACGPKGAGGGSPSPAPPAPATPAPTASATPVPIRVETRGANGRYVTIVQTQHGRKVYTIRAAGTTAQRFGTNEATGELQQPHVTFVDRTGVRTVADAPKASLSDRDKSVVMTGGVHARTSSGSVLSCDTLTYDAKTERFHGQGDVHLTAPNGLSLSGDHLDGDVRLQDVSVTGGAS